MKWKNLFFILFFINIQKRNWAFILSFQCTVFLSPFYATQVETMNLGNLAKKKNVIVFIWHLASHTEQHVARAKASREYWEASHVLNTESSGLSVPHCAVPNPLWGLTLMNAQAI